MGTFGAGNFESDAALDLVAKTRAVAESELTAFLDSDDVGVEDLERVMAAVAIHLVLDEHCGAGAPEVDFAIRLRDKALAIFDEEMPELDPDGEFARERRTVIVDTFTRYEAAAREQFG
jgi:hypothetical protein